MDTTADSLVFQLDDAAWAEFCAILDRPAQRIPELVELFAERAPWDTEPLARNTGVTLQ